MTNRHAVFMALVLAGPAAIAQEAPSSVFQGGVPTGEATSDELALSLPEAVDRGLHYNLGLILGREDVRAAQGARAEARADLLPQVRAGLLEIRQKINLASFGFGGFPGFPEIVGPFNVFDARAFLSQAVLDLKALHHARAASKQLRAAGHEERNTRELVVLACAGLYLQTVAGGSRIGAPPAPLDTAEAPPPPAPDPKAA